MTDSTTSETETKPRGAPSSRALEYIHSAAESSARARRVLTLLSTLAIFIFGVYWNAFHGFTNQRVRVLSNAIQWQHKLQGGTCPSEAEKDLRRDCDKATVFWRYLAEREHEVSDTVLANIARMELNALRKERAEDLRRVSIPGLNVSVDLGDVWVFASIIFASLLFWLVYAIHCEIRDTHKAFLIAKQENELPLCRDLLTMEQVFTIPPIDAPKWTPLWRYAPKAMFLFPIAAQGVGFALGAEYRRHYMFDLSIWSWETLLAFFPLAISVCLTGSSLLLSRKYDQMWTTYGKDKGTTSPRHSNS